jgi:predicted transcriptional regulator
MGQNADDFLSSFNRIEKFFKQALNNPTNMGFAEMSRRLSRARNSQVSRFETELLEFAQLRNAIVHSQIESDFIIAEPNDWAVARIQKIEQALTAPEKVIPRFGRKVTGFEKDVPLKDLLRIIAKKGYSTFPLYQKGKFIGLITLRVVGYWFAVESQFGPLHIEDKVASDLLMEHGKSVNYEFVNAKTPIYKVRDRFRENTFLEAVLITKNGSSSGELLGIIRPRDIFNEKEV